jgi:8-oxo-dGTP pyrophosphatase MutT (NUDIX family)
MTKEREYIEALEHRLLGPKPGLSAQMTLCPRPLPGMKGMDEMESAGQRAAVLILLYPRDGDLHVLLVRRTENVLHHKNQISLPGGRLHKGEDDVQAALRETYEETGVPPEAVRIIGSLSPLYIPRSDHRIYPVVGYADTPLNFVPESREVAEIIEVPLAHLIRPEAVRKETWTLGDRPSEIPFYEFNDAKIWGATAMVLAEFLVIVKTVQGI